MSDTSKTEEKEELNLTKDLNSELQFEVESLEGQVAQEPHPGHGSLSRPVEAVCLGSGVGSAVRVTVKLYASLVDYLPAEARNYQVDMEFPMPMSLSGVVSRLNLPEERIHLVLLNGVYVEPEARGGTTVSDGDAVAIWPPIAGG